MDKKIILFLIFSCFASSTPAFAWWWTSATDKDVGKMEQTWNTDVDQYTDQYNRYQRVITLIDFLKFQIDRDQKTHNDLVAQQTRIKTEMDAAAQAVGDASTNPSVKAIKGNELDALKHQYGDLEKQIKKVDDDKPKWSAKLEAAGVDPRSSDTLKKLQDDFKAEQEAMVGSLSSLKDNKAEKLMRKIKPESFNSLVVAKAQKLDDSNPYDKLISMGFKSKDVNSFKSQPKAVQAAAAPPAPPLTSPASTSPLTPPTLLLDLNSIHFTPRGRFPSVVQVASETSAEKRQGTATTSTEAKDKQASEDAKPKFSCDQVYVELAKLVMTTKDGPTILDGMIKSTAIKTALLMNKYKSESIEEFAKKQNLPDGGKLKEQITKLYLNSGADVDAQKLTSAVANVGSDKANYYSTTLRFKNEDASAFLYALSQTEPFNKQFSVTDAATIWAQAQIFAKNGYTKLGGTKPNQANFSTQVYLISQSLTLKSDTTKNQEKDKISFIKRDQTDIDGQIAKEKNQEKTLDDKTLTAIQQDTKEIFASDNNNPILTQIKSTNKDLHCLQDDNKSDCSLATPTLGVDSVEKIKSMIAVIAAGKQMAGINQQYKLEKPEIKDDGGFNVQVVPSQ